MRKTHLIIFLIISILFLTNLHCNFQGSKIKSIKLERKNDKGKRVNARGVFLSSDTTFFLEVIAGNNQELDLRTEWYAIQNKKNPEPQLISEKSFTVTSESSIAVFQISKETPWPRGDYQVILYVDNERYEVINFIVR